MWVNHAEIVALFSIPLVRVFPCFLSSFLPSLATVILVDESKQEALDRKMRLWRLERLSDRQDVARIKKTEKGIKRWQKWKIPLRPNEGAKQFVAICCGQLLTNAFNIAQCCFPPFWKRDFAAVVAVAAVAVGFSVSHSEIEAWTHSAHVSHTYTLILPALPKVTILEFRWRWWRSMRMANVCMFVISAWQLKNSNLSENEEIKNVETFVGKKADYDRA